MKLKHIKEILESSIDISSIVLKSCAIGGTKLPYQIKQTFDSGHPARQCTFTSIFFCLHSVTHLDLPTGLNWDGIRRASDLPEDLSNFEPEVEIVEEKLLKTKILPCYILDFTEKARNIKKYMEIPTDDGLATETLMPLGFDEFLKLYENLMITQEDIRIILSESKLDVTDSILLFHTGWTEFCPYTYDISHPRWECWHIYLTHPFISEDAIIYLLKKGIAGIGSDTIDLEDPLYYTTADRVIPSYIPGSLIRKLKSYKPLHTLLLGNYKYLIENLDLRRIENDKIVKKGALLISPMIFGDFDHEQLKVEDAAPCSVSFLQGKWE